MPPVLACEADCNLGKSFAIFCEMIRPLLRANPKLPMLFFSVRITHAYDLFATLQRYFVDEDGDPIAGMNLVCYKEGDETVRERCANATQLVISPQTAALDCLGDDLSRFHGGVLVLDEAVSLALTLGQEKRGTIDDPMRLVRILTRLTKDIMPHVVVMDRDLTLTPLASKLLALLTPERNVAHFQFERPGQQNALCYTWDSKRAFQRFKLDAMHCRETFAATPDDGSEAGRGTPCSASSACSWRSWRCAWASLRRACARWSTRASLRSASHTATRTR